MEPQQQLQLLVLRAKDGEQKAWYTLYERFSYMINQVCCKRFKNFENKDDLYSWALEGFMRAIQSYDPARGTTLEYWIRENIRWMIFLELKRRRMYSINVNENENIINLNKDNVSLDDLLDCLNYLRRMVRENEKYLLHLLLIVLKEFLGYGWRDIVQILNHQEKPEIWDEIINKPIFIFEIFPKLRDWNSVRCLINSLNLVNGLFTEENIRQRYSRVQREMQNRFLNLL